MSLSEAATKLARELQTKSVTVGHSNDEANPLIIVYLHSRKCFKLPMVYEGYPVQSQYVGKIRPCS